MSALRRSLGARTLVEFVELDGVLHAVVVTPTRSRLVHLGDTDATLAAHDHLTFALRRLSMLPAHHPGLDAAAMALDRAAVDVDDLLIAPLRVRSGEVVIVPTGGLHRIAWSALPSLHGVAVTVAPSAAWWMARGAGPRPPAGPDRVLLVEGPDLEGTSAELGAIAELIPNAVTLLGEEATASRVIAELATADIAHIAAHGAFRGDNPLFSSLRVADGPIWVHDLSALPRTPRLVILTACEAGRSGVLAGDELLGTATALLSLGVDTVVAPLLPVPDIATSRFAIRLHHHLATGATPAQARARTAADERASGDPTGVAVASTFQCIGNRLGDSSKNLVSDEGWPRSVTRVLLPVRGRPHRQASTGRRCRDHRPQRAATERSEHIGHRCLGSHPWVRPGSRRSRRSPSCATQPSPVTNEHGGRSSTR